MTDISGSERIICAGLKPLLEENLEGESLGDNRSARELMAAFEFFFQEVLRGTHDEWQHECLDGVLSSVFRKVGEREAELLGMVIFLDDQTLTPVHFRLQLSPTFDRVSWLDLRLGERTESGCLRVPYGQSKAQGGTLRVADCYDSIDWFYHVGCGERDS